MQHLDDNGIDFDDVVLFASDQEGRYRVTDTLYVAYLFEMFLKKRKPHASITIARITQNPQDYDAMMDFYEQFVEAEQPKIEANFKNILVLAPGTPACTFALVIHFLPFLNTVYPIYVPIGGEAKKVSVMTGLVKEGYRRLIAHSVGSYDYPSAERILKEANFRDESLAYLFSALSHRLNFRFDRALEEFRRVQMKAEGEWDRFEADFFALAHPDAIQEKIIALLHNIEVRFARREFLEGVALIFRLQEAVLTEAVEEVLGIEIKKEDGKFPSFQKAIKGDLLAYLQGKRIRFDRPNRLVFTQILSYHSERETDVKRKEKWQAILDFSSKIGEISDDIYTTERLKSLGDLRNASPFGHRFEGINEEDIERAYRGGVRMLLDDLRAFLCEHLGEGVPVNFCDRINQAILEKVGSLD